MRLTCGVRLLVAFNQQCCRSPWPLMLPLFDRLSALLSLALMHCAFWPDPALKITEVRNRVAQQVSIWLSALRQPAHHRAAPKCHTPSLVGFLSFGSQHITAACACLFMRISRRIDDSMSSSPCRWFTVLGTSGTIPSSHTKGSQGMQWPSIIRHPGKVSLFSLAGPSRPGLTVWSRGRFDLRSLRQGHAGAPYRGR